MKLKSDLNKSKKMKYFFACYDIVFIDYLIFYIIISNIVKSIRVIGCVELSLPGVNVIKLFILVTYEVAK